MKTRFVTGTLGLVFLAAAAGCGGSEQGSDMGHWEAKAGSNFVGNDDSERADDENFSGKIVPIGFNWVGVRPDLAINPSRPRKPTCSCLSVEVGSANDSKFVWRGARPEIAPQNLAVAISAVGVDCPGGATNPGDRRPSISAVWRVNGDVVVEVEEISSDRPMATGAIIAPPEANGKVFVRPRNKLLPYARPSSGNLCRVM